jgi:acetyltransferase-like isoleucine patch superfamily enzyme
MIDARVLGGSCLAYFYNGLLGKCPSRMLRGLYLRSYLASFGPGTGVQMGCRFLNGRKVHLGARNVINFGCLLDGRRYEIRTGSDVSIGPEASILTLGHDPQSPDFADKGGEVIIGDRAWICYRAVILPGVRVGEGAVVGAGAVVSRNVEPYTIVAGSPARAIGARTKELHYYCHFNPWLG